MGVSVADRSIPAFPRPASVDTELGTLADGDKVIRHQDGMNLRDYFAAHAPIEVPAWYQHVEPPGKVDTYCPGSVAWRSRDQFARKCQWAFSWADAMLEARGAVSRG